jgi:hypothetical protein
MKLTVEFLKIGKVATDNKHLVGLKTDKTGAEVQRLLLGAGVHYFLIEINDQIDYTCSGDGALSYLFDLLQDLPPNEADVFASSVERQGDLRAELDAEIAKAKNND